MIESQVYWGKIEKHDFSRRLPEILSLVERERQNSNSYLNVQDSDFYSKFGDDAGEAFAAFDRGKVIAFGLLGYAHFVRDLWLPYLKTLQANLHECAVLIHILVAPEYRGQKIGENLSFLRILQSQRQGIRHLLGTVHPENQAMLKIYNRYGFQELDRKIVYQAQLPRVLLHKKIEAIALPKIPNVRLANLPTPLELMPRLSRILGGPELWIKRDDLTGLATGGNKTRMLERFIADALAQGKQTLITRGALVSNHCRQTAAAAAKYGMNCILVIRGYPPPHFQGNILLDSLLGADIRFTEQCDPDRFLDRTFKEAQAQGFKPYLIAYGGAHSLGSSAYVDAVQELLSQSVSFDRIILPTSSGATQAGLLLGKIIHALPAMIHGISVDEKSVSIAPKISQLISDLSLQYQIDKLMNLQNKNAYIQIDDRFLGEGYAVVGQREREAIHLFAKNEGILLDPVYTARAAGGMIELIRKGEIGPREKVLFWHTGGLPSLFSLSERVLENAEILKIQQNSKREI